MGYRREAGRRDVIGDVQMRILFLGGHYPGLFSGLRARGAEPVFIDPFRGDKSPPWMRWVSWAKVLDTGGMARLLVREAAEKRADAMLVFKGWFSPRVQIHRAAVAAVRERGVKTIYWSLDDPYFVEKHQGFYHAHPEAYDAYLTCCLETVGQARSRGYRVAALMWPAYDPELWPPGDAYETGPDLSIVGSPYGPALGLGKFDRIQIANRVAAMGLSVEVHGDASWLSRGLNRSLYRKYLPRPENGRVARRARVCLGTHVRSSRGYLNARVFQVMGAGGLLLSDVSDGPATHGPDAFMIDKETFVRIPDGASERDVAALVARWAADDRSAERARIKRRASEVIAAGKHVYSERAEIIMSTVRNLMG